MGWVALIVQAHTVQYYSFFDPAPTYGNENFTYMFEFMIEEVEKESVICGSTVPLNDLPRRTTANRFTLGRLHIGW